MGLDDTAMREIERGLLVAPEAHLVIRGLRGVRKARFPLPGRGKCGTGRCQTVYGMATAVDGPTMLEGER